MVACQEKSPRGPACGETAISLGKAAALCHAKGQARAVLTPWFWWVPKRQIKNETRRKALN